MSQFESKQGFILIIYSRMMSDRFPADFCSGAERSAKLESKGLRFSWGVEAAAAAAQW